jgi:molecular chaperone IbpA
MAVAGFSDDEISIEAHRNVLTIKGERSEEKNAEGSELLYRGIASRSFERRFQLADHVEVVGANLKNGLLHIDLKRTIPEELKPRKIAISSVSGNTAKQIEGQSVN